MANLSTLTVGLLVNAVSFRSQITEAYRHAGRESEKFSGKAKSDAKKAESAYHSLGKSIKSVGGQLALLSGVGFSLGSIINTTRKYGQALSDLSAITGATGAQLKKLDDAAQQLGRTTEFGATRIATALKLMASAKPELLKSTDALVQATEKSVILAQASGIELPEATKALALSLNQFGASAEQADRYINVLAAGAKYGSSEINETAQAIKNGGTMAAQASVSFEELNAVIQILAAGGIKGAEAGTAIRNVILALEKSTDKKLKPSVVGLGAALDHLKSKKLSTAEAAKLFGRANVSAASKLVVGRGKLEELKQSLTGTQVAYEQAGERANNLSADLDVLSSAFEGLAVKVGGSADGPLRSGIQGATSAINTLSENFNLVANVALYTLLPVMATKLTAGLRENVSAWKATEKATRDAAKQQAETAKRTIESARAERERAAQQSRWMATQSVINKQNGVYVNYQKDYIANSRKIRESIITETSAKKQLAEANRKLSYSTRLMSGAAAGASGALAMVGGSFGAAALAGFALYGLYNHSVQTREGLRQLKDTTIETVEELQRLSKVKVQLKIDDWKEKLEELQGEKKQLESKMGGYSNIKINLAKSHEKNAFGRLFNRSSKTLLKGRNETLSKLEDTYASIKQVQEAIKNGEQTFSVGKFDVPPPPPKPEGGNNNPWIGEGTGGNDKGDKKGKQTLNQYQQLRKEIEQAHTTSLGRIILSEREIQGKLIEVGKSGLVSQNELLRLKNLNAENHQKQRIELAEKYAPAKALTRQEKEASQELKAIYDARLLTEQEYLSASKTLYQTSVKEKLAEQAKGLAAPRLDMAGEVDPVIQLQNQLTQQTALYDAYYRNGLISKERHEALVAAATNKSKESQFAASKELYASQGDFQAMQMNLLDVVEQRTGNALTGMLMGTKSFSESMKELSASLAQSIIQDLVRIAMQALITKAVSGFFGGAGGGETTLANGQAVPMLPKNISTFAKGGTLSSPSLSAYSGLVVSNPTLFKFAHGAGLMGEAGPEAILPLKRGPDGALGVRAAGGTGNQTNIKVDIVVHPDKNSEVKTTSGFESAGQDIAKFVDQRFKSLLHKSLGQGGDLNVAIKGGRR
ncbi:phage tail tape measure protein [Xenorhabdus bovienii]|uniref:Phage tail tape measure protein n=1 Tax=Xenorhabdus bovienii TaxID=40576 RepID=A0AAJ1JD77_XENBV|nr:phage tail tape measure protein [Xenorhabdus bovienii]MDE1480436.1 phage tail tape measure protein [Xenorhabdus bovienii]MDE9512120.1 phage tail tape measure protein [Xenorhabdus bovienii]MDE9523781.1 phage tail tape measure protein [Xenorhabdus bovienii]